ncbi:MAG: hypothetical protein C0619_07565 [Desulfuromonas sp.]|nr:MAG: hypothetical protein C0619_07565 [Desulfuromonas sp.]
MGEIISAGHRQALDMMSVARKILFRELHYPESRTRELVEGVDRLSLAFEYVENPLGDVLLCPECECFCLETFEDGSFTCLSCDHHWS